MNRELVLGRHDATILWTGQGLVNMDGGAIVRDAVEHSTALVFIHNEPAFHFRRVGRVKYKGWEITNGSPYCITSPEYKADGPFGVASTSSQQSPLRHSRISVILSRLLHQSFLSSHDYTASSLGLPVFRLPDKQA